MNNNMDRMNVHINSLLKQQFEGEFDTIIVPGVLGHIGLTKSDRTYVNFLNAGVIYLFNQDIIEKRWFIFGGTVFAKNNIVNIDVSLEAIDIEKLNKTDIQNQINVKEQEVVALNKQIHKAKLENKDFYNSQIFIWESSVEYIKDKISSYKLLLHLADNCEY